MACWSVESVDRSQGEEELLAGAGEEAMGWGGGRRTVIVRFLFSLIWDGERRKGRGGEVKGHG